MTIPPPITPKVFKTYELVRLVSAVFLLGIVGMLYFHMRQASSWAWLIKDKDTEAAVQGTEKPWEETIVPHDGSEDPEQKEEAAYEAQALSDNQDVLSEEMPLYWRMLRWSLSEKFADLKARVAKTVDFLKTVTAAQVKDAESRNIEIKFSSGSWKFTGLAYVNDFVLPNFYFHEVMVYALLRKNGVEIGKFDFLGAIQ